jgi:hypothetical protein
MELETAEWLEPHLYDIRQNAVLLATNLKLKAITDKSLEPLASAAALMVKQIEVVYTDAKNDLEEAKADIDIDDDRAYDLQKNEQRKAS